MPAAHQTDEQAPPPEGGGRDDQSAASPLRILIATGIFPPDIGGPATYIPLIAGRLRARGHNVHVLTTGTPGEFSFGVGEAAFPVERIARRPIVLRYTRFFARVHAHARRAHVVLANGMFEETVAAAKLASTPVVVKFVGDEAWERSVRKGWTSANLDEFQLQRARAPVRLLKMLRSISARSADRIIVPSRYLQKIVRGWGAPAARCRVVYNAVATPNSRDVTRSRGGEYRILTVGRLVAWKGMDLAIRALVGIQDARLTIVGEGPLRASLEEAARTSGVASRVVFTGQMAPDQLRETMREHDVFVLASRYEGLPHIVLEAMQESLPVIATNVGGTPEVVLPDVSGVLVPPDEHAIAAAIQMLRANPVRVESLVAGAHNLLRDQFSVSRMVAETEAVLLEAALHHGRAASRSRAADRP